MNQKDVERLNKWSGSFVSGTKRRAKKLAPKKEEPKPEKLSEEEVEALAGERWANED